jgi:hypothetical protein
MNLPRSAMIPFSQLTQVRQKVVFSLSFGGLLFFI